MSKIQAARATVEAGTACWITSGIVEDQLANGIQRIMRHEVPETGTLVSGGLEGWKR